MFIILIFAMLFCGCPLQYRSLSLSLIIQFYICIILYNIRIANQCAVESKFYTLKCWYAIHFILVLHSVFPGFFRWNPPTHTPFNEVNTSFCNIVRFYCCSLHSTLQFLDLWNCFGFLCIHKSLFFVWWGVMAFDKCITC